MKYRNWLKRIPVVLLILFLVFILLPFLLMLLSYVFRFYGINIFNGIFAQCSIIFPGWFCLLNQVKERDQTIQLLVAVGTIGAVIVALFQESIKRWFYKPILKLSVKNKEPWCNNVKQYNHCGYIGDALYIRIKVENVGNEVAKDIQIFAKNINPIEGIDKGKIWLEMDLQWSNTGDSYYPLIYPNTAKYCDLGFILDPNARQYDKRYFFQNTWNGKYREIDPALLMNVKYPLGGGDHILGPGKYEIEIVAAAVGAKLVKQTVVIEFNDWSQNADERMKSVRLDSKKNSL